MYTQTPKTVVGTLCYLIRAVDGIEEVCLAWKEPTEKAFKLALADRWNGYGGGQESKDVSIEATAMREIREESGVIVASKDLEKVAEILFINAWGNYLCHFFLAKTVSVDPRPTKEMSRPTWFPKTSLPYESMMDSDKYFLPEIIKGKKLKGRIVYDENGEVAESELLFVEKF